MVEPRQKIPGGFRMMKGARDVTTLRSVIATARKRRRADHRSPAGVLTAAVHQALCWTHCRVSER